MMSVDPQEILDRRKLVSETDITGNCRPWSDHVYYKLFLDPDGRNATLMVLKCEITYVDVFTDEEHSLYKCRFIGGKADGVAQLFVFDLMKAKWEEKIPRSQAIELNVDIVMSSSPIHQCSETLLKLVQLEKTFLRHRNFDGQLNVTIRFAHSYGWDVKDDAIRERVHDGLRNLFREGVNLEVMSADIILDEIRVDEILATDDDLIKHYVSKRHAWTTPPLKASTTRCTSGESSTRHITNRSNYDSDFSSASEEDFEYLSEDDMYHVFLLDNLDQILANQYRSKPTVTRRAGRGRKHNPKRNKPVW
uniref:Uncharacterized protein n=1 Tax=Ciona savignyi TaxID=51511 RepID=H2YIR4_CIOSA